MIVLFKKSNVILFTLLTITIIMIITFFNVIYFKSNINLFMGGQLKEHTVDLSPYDMAISVSNLNKINPDEKYFRPSKLPILNNKRVDTDFLFDYWGKKPEEIVIPEILLKTPEDTIVNYFNIIKHGENLVEGKIGGCGSVGDSTLPYFITYNFFSRKYKENTNFNNYLKSFEGIGHVNLIKLHKVPVESEKINFIRYFIEIETIEGSDKDITYFAYYYGYVYLTLEKNLYLISKIDLYGEDFLCAPYHGWQHLAEANVDIRYGNWCGLMKERYPTEQDGYVKNIYFKGTDNEDYLIVFFELTNGTDIEIAQYKKDFKGDWKLIRLDPENCIEENINR